MNKRKYNDSWMFIFLLSTLLILTESVKNYTFTIQNLEFTYAIFIIPFLYFITDYITKKYGFKRGLTSIVVSAIALIAFILVMNFSLGSTFDFSCLNGGLIGYIVSQMVNVMIYRFLLINTTSPFVLVLLNYVFGLVIFYVVYTLVNMNITITNTFWVEYFIVLVVQTLMCIALTVIDKKIPLGLGKDD